MSDSLQHECGIALVRLKKPLSYYLSKYGTALYGYNKMYLLMQKQYNRGQDAAGIASIKLDMEPGTRYISRYRSIDNQPIQDLFATINQKIEERTGGQGSLLQDPDWVKENIPIAGEVYLGHLRYGTYGKNALENAHPFLRQNNWTTRNLLLAGNFNMTNVDELFNKLVALGQHPKEKADTVTILEKIGHFLDEENEKQYRKLKEEGITKREASALIGKRLRVGKILRRSAKYWDGGYVMAGLIGHGDAFVLRDPSGIRPAFWYEDDEVVVVASERPVIQTAFNVPVENIQEIQPGHALIIKQDTTVYEELVREPLEKKSCSFERIYFSRGSDADIYQERLALGKRLVPRILKSIEGDLENTVFSFIPNTAEVAFYGVVKGMEDHLDGWKKDQIRQRGASMTDAELVNILALRPRAEKVAWKDVKLRTFITDDSSRDDLVSHVYDITYGAVKPTDNLVVIDDSIVRGTTLRQSILRILDRLGPKKIVIVSSAPQIRYPDCYGIDMAKMGDFVAFQAAISLLKERGMDSVIQEVYQAAKAEEGKPLEEIQNRVQAIYAPFTAEEIASKVAQLLRPQDLNAEVEIVYQGIDDLHAAIPGHSGDWYFTGNYPTPGGNRVANRSFVNFIEGRNRRAY
jgi:amidophosphoribosyltransferase